MKNVDLGMLSLMPYYGFCIGDNLLAIKKQDSASEGDIICYISLVPEKEFEVTCKEEYKEDVLRLIIYINDIFGARNYMEEKSKKEPVVKEQAQESIYNQLKSGDVLELINGKEYFFLKDTAFGDVLVSKEEDDVVIDFKLNYKEDLSHNTKPNLNIKKIKRATKLDKLLTYSDESYEVINERCPNEILEQIDREIDELIKRKREMIDKANWR